jgi:hypothetical protein
MNIEEIANNYKKLPTYKLSELAKDPDGLSTEVIPVLQRELLSRGEQDDALKLTEYLIEIQKQPLKHEDFQQEIKDRLAAGETLESIALKFKENGVDVYDEIAKEGQLQENTFDYILSLREKGISEEEIHQKLQHDLSLSESEVEIVKQKLRRKGKINIVVGWSATVITVIITILSLAVGGGPGVGAIILLGIGIWRIVEGNRILKDQQN